MKKLSIGLLDELAKNQQRISELEMKSFVGGGDGTEDDPYTFSEMTSLMDSNGWIGGYVEYMGYVGYSQFVYGNPYGGVCTQYTCTPADFAIYMHQNGMDSIAEMILQEIPLFGGLFSQTADTFTQCKDQIMHDITELGQGNNMIDSVITSNDNGSTDMTYSWNVYDRTTGALLVSYTVNPFTGNYKKNG